MSVPINQSATIKPVSQPVSKPGPPNPSGKGSMPATSSTVMAATSSKPKVVR